jgi:ribose transport system substrate-binding protein
MMAKGRKLSLTQRLDEHRALLMLLAMLAFWTVFTDNFMNAGNMTSLLKGASLNAVVAIGFTVIFILGQLDLSIGATVMLCGMLAIGLQPQTGWAGSISLAMLAGIVIGFVNGILVVKAKINSFIVTLGTMIIVTGLMHLYSGGGSFAVTEYTLSDWLGRPVLPYLTPMAIITFALVAGCALVLKHTAFGRGVFVVGANPETAWLAGLNTDLYLISGFIFCSAMAAVGGILIAIDLTSMTSYAVLGTTTLMTVLAAVIIGGTLMSGGRGSVVKSYFAVLMLTALRNGMGCRGLGFEVEIFVNGLILAAVVLYESFVINRQTLLKGQRPGLMREAEEIRTARRNETENPVEDEMKSNQKFALVCVTLAAIVAMVAIYAMHLNTVSHRQPVQFTAAGVPAGSAPPAGQSSFERSVDVSSLRSSDGQPLLLRGSPKPVPPRPADPSALPQTEKGRWWDIEFAGWETEKMPMPESPGTGPAGKRVILMKAGDHPYWTAYVNGFMKIAEAHGMDVKVYNGNWNVHLQAQQTDQAINEKPDMIIFAPVDATACTPLLRKINAAGIPCITSNTIPSEEAMQYCLAWTGPDDWGQFRELTRMFADAMGKKGGFVIVRHMPGSSPFFARTFAPITELKAYAPDMRMLAMDSANLEAEGTLQLMSAWLKKYGDDLQGVISACDGFGMTGILEAARAAGRPDLIIVAAGNSKTGMDSIKKGDAYAITYQSAEGDGALALQTAAEWFQGKSIPPVRYLPVHIITKDDVDDFMPAQW